MSTERFLDGQTALVTGGSSGIGAAISVELARRGADVVVNYRGSKEGAEETARHCREHGVRAAIAQADVGEASEVEAMFAQTVDSMGRLDILVNNAGMQDDASLLEMSAQAWRRVIDTNLTGQFLCTQQAARQFLNQPERVLASGNGRRPARSKPARGKIVFISSVHDIIPWAGHVNYAASKGGVLMLMKSVAQELANQRIRANAVSPGAIKTAINQSVWQDKESAEKVLELIPYQRWGEPEDIGETVAWLCSDYADYVTGAVLYVDGGMTLYPEFIDNG